MTTAFFHYIIVVMNYYEVLGVAKSASPEEIKRSYRRLASKHHPDKGGDTSKFQQIEEAYRVLSDPQQRAEFDNPRPAANHNFHFNFNGNDVNIQDIFSQFGFDPFGGNHPFQQTRRNKDVKTSINLKLRETLDNQSKTLNIKIAEGSQRNVEIVIPRGITAGTTIKYPGLGDTLFTNLPPGDLYITVNVEQEPNYQISGLDLITSLTIDCFQAILGSEQTVYGLDGKQFVIQTPQGCQPGMKLKISGEGLWQFQNDVKGSLYINIGVSIPKNLSQDQLQLVQTIANQR